MNEARQGHEDAQQAERPRVIDSHQINECNSAIAIRADQRDPKNGNASHVYRLIWPTDVGDGGVMHEIVLSFQHGPIAEVGTNGITHEALLAILIDRLEGFQEGPYACEENASALDHLKHAVSALRTRTKKRVARGVEGTHQV